MSGFATIGLKGFISTIKSTLKEIWEVVAEIRQEPKIRKLEADVKLWQNKYNKLMEKFNETLITGKPPVKSRRKNEPK